MSDATPNVPPPARSARGIVLFFALWSLWLTAPYGMRGPLSYLKIHVNADGHIPQTLWMLHYSQAGLAPLIDPSMCASDRMVDFGLPNLVHLLALLMPLQPVFVILMFLQAFVACSSMFLFGRSVLRLPASVAWLAGLAYSVGATRGEDVGVDWTYLHLLAEPGLPLLLWAACRLPLADGKKGLAWALTIGVGLSLTSLIEFGFGFIYPCAVLFGLLAREDVRGFRSGVRYLLLMGVAGACVVVFQWPHLWGMILNAPESARGILQIEKKTWGWAAGRILWRLGRMKLPILLGAVWLLRFRWKSRTEWAVLSLAAITVVLGPYSRPLGQLLWNHVPVLSGFFFDRLAMYGPCFVLCGAALGVARLPMPALQMTAAWRKWQGAFTGRDAFCALLSLAVVYGSIQSFKVYLDESRMARRQGQNWHYLFGRPELKALSRQIDGRPARTVTVNASDSTEAWQPTFNLAYGLETADGFKMLYPWRYHQFWRQVVDRAYRASAENLTRSFMDLSGSRMYLFPPEPTDPVSGPQYNLPLLSLANVVYFVSRTPLDDPRLRLLPRSSAEDESPRGMATSLFAQAWALLTGRLYLGQPLYIYENPLAFPRFRLVPRAKTFATSAEVLTALREASADELRGAVYGLAREVPDAGAAVEGDGQGEVLVKSYSLERSRIETRADQSMFLTVANTYSPFWRFRVDGQPVPHFPAYHTFMGIRVPPGVHAVDIEYAPPYAGWCRTLWGWTRRR